MHCTGNLVKPLRLPQVFHNQGLSNQCPQVSSAYLFDTLVSGMGRVASWAGWGGQLVFLRGRCPAGGEEARGGLASITASPPLNLLASYQRNSNNAERYTRPNLIHLKENRFFLNKVLLISLCYPLTKIKLGHWSDISKYHCFFDVKEKHSESFFSNWKTCVFT